MSQLANMKERFLKEPTLISQLPLRLSNNCELSEIVGICSQCNREVGEHVHGVITQPLPDLISFDAHGICADCLNIFPLYGRVRGTASGMQMEWVHKGRWRCAPMECDSKFIAITKWLTRWLGKIF